MTIVTLKGVAIYALLRTRGSRTIPRDQRHRGSEDRIRQTMRAERVSFAGAIRWLHNLMVGTPAVNIDTYRICSSPKPPTGLC
jgi:hypothetical protein